MCRENCESTIHETGRCNAGIGYDLILQLKKKCFQVKIGNDQENAQPEGDSHSKNRDGKNKNNQTKLSLFTKSVFHHSYLNSRLSLPSVSFFAHLG